MPAGVAAASDEAGRGVPGPTTDRPGVPSRGGEEEKPPDDVRKARALAPMVEERPKLRRSSGGMRRTALSLGARGEIRGRRSPSRSDAEAWRDEANELKEPWPRLDGGACMAAIGFDF